MAIAVSNSIPRTGNSLIDGLVQGGSWTADGSSSDTAHQLTYSLTWLGNRSIADWLADPISSALAAWSDVADISFTKVGPDWVTPVTDSNADLTFHAHGRVRRDFGAVGLAVFPDPHNGDAFLQALSEVLGTTDRSNYPNPEGDVFIETSSPGVTYTQPGGAELQILIHEIGHALGLKHPFDPGGNDRPTSRSSGSVRKIPASGRS